MDLEVHNLSDIAENAPHLFQLLQRFRQHHQARQPQVQVAAEVQAALLLAVGSRFWTQKMNHLEVGQNLVPLVNPKIAGIYGCSSH